MQYRPEIDGLRAIAVILVLLYHASFEIYGRHHLFSAGEIGVDIFFVISGYLITTIILKELRETDRFSFWNFYERRARRILPVLFFVILVCYPVAFRILPPVELSHFLDSILSIVFFVSNYFFYYHSANFSVDSATLEPFLHTWSLAVEEQFYLIFPVILLVIHRYFPKFILSIFLLLFFLSLQIAEEGSQRFPEFNYFTLASRFWELLAGSILAYLEVEYGRLRHAVLNAVMPVIGLFMIGWFLFLFDNDPAHPSYLTFIPVFGTVLIIAFSSKEDLVGRILGTRPFVAVGLISYSLYLWHMPIFVFFDYVRPDTANLEKIWWIILSFLMATLSYYMVEQPFRNRQLMTARPFYLTLVATAIAILGVSFFGEVGKARLLTYLIE